MKATDEFFAAEKLPMVPTPPHRHSVHDRVSSSKAQATAKSLFVKDFLAVSISAVTTLKTV